MLLLDPDGRVALLLEPLLLILNQLLLLLLAPPLLQLELGLECSLDVIRIGLPSESEGLHHQVVRSVLGHELLHLRHVCAGLVPAVVHEVPAEPVHGVVQSVDGSVEGGLGLSITDLGVPLRAQE